MTRVDLDINVHHSNWNRFTWDTAWDFMDPPELSVNKIRDQIKEIT